MTTSYTPTQDPQEPYRDPPQQREIKVTRLIRRNDELKRKPFPSRLIDYLPPTSGPTSNGNHNAMASVAHQQLPQVSNATKPATDHALHVPAAPPTSVHHMAQEPEIEEYNIILHRSPNFFVRTANRHGQKLHPLRRRSGATAISPTVTLQQEKRIAASDTRLMPIVSPINPVHLQALPIPAWLEGIVVLVGLLASSMMQAFNMFSFPNYELDEGTYMSNAWAIFHGMIEPYPYGYGHPPLGWIQIATWVKLTGGFFTFGDAINSGRVLMLFYAFGCSLLVYLIIRRLQGSRSAALLALLIFSLSPLSIIYHRQVLLDNIGTFWLLLSLYLLVVSNSRLPYIVCAATCYGIALLSKEVFLFFMPGLMYALWLHTTKFQRKFALIAFSYTIIAIGSTFLLLALLKGELLPVGVLPWDHHPHLSLLGTYFVQAQRGQAAGKLSDSVITWTSKDPLLIILSATSIVFNLIAGWWNRRLLLLSLLAISFWILILRGGVVFPFYIIPLIPLIACNTATAVNIIARGISRLVGIDLVRVIVILATIVVILSYNVQHFMTFSTLQSTSPQTSALTWVRNYVPRNSFIVISDYLYTDLHEEGGMGVGNGPTYPYANLYWNVAYDPEIHDALLHNNWDRIDYIVTDSNMLYDIKTFQGPMLLIQQALQHSALRAEFQTDNQGQQTDIRIYQVIHNPSSSGI